MDPKQSFLAIIVMESWGLRKWVGNGEAAMERLSLSRQGEPLSASTVVVFVCVCCTICKATDA